VLLDKIVHLRKKSNNILQLQMPISFEKKHSYIELYNKLLHASHVSLVFEKRNSIETLICPVFSGEITQKCSFPHQS